MTSSCCATRATSCWTSWASKGSGGGAPPRGVEGQRRLRAAHALVIGAGGLGSPVALYLGTAGVGRLTIVDDDRVDLTNLQRQIAHTAARIGQPKAESAAQSVRAINPDVEVT